MKREKTILQRLREARQREEWYTIRRKVKQRQQKEQPMRFIIYTDKAGESRWRLVAKNGQTVADSGEGYHSPGNARRAIKSFQKLVGKAAIEAVKPKKVGVADETA